MTTIDVYCSLFNEKSDRQIDGLTFSQARGFIDAVADPHRAEWFSWHEGLPSWKPIGEFRELARETPAKIRQIPPHPSAPKKSAPSNELDLPVLELRDDATRISIQLDERGYSDHRLNRRFVQRYVVTIQYLGAAHQNATLDISMGGMSLATKLPEGLVGRFVAVLAHARGERLELNCLLIPEKNDSTKSRVRFQLDARTEPVLRSWLLGAGEEQA